LPTSRTSNASTKTPLTHLRVKDKRETQADVTKEAGKQVTSSQPRVAMRYLFDRPLSMVEALASRRRRNDARFATPRLFAGDIGFLKALASDTPKSLFGQIGSETVVRPDKTPAFNCGIGTKICPTTSVGSGGTGGRDQTVTSDGFILAARARAIPTTPAIRANNLVQRDTPVRRHSAGSLISAGLRRGSKLATEVPGIKILRRVLHHADFRSWRPVHCSIWMKARCSG
jgi:hypothetical protein